MLSVLALLVRPACTRGIVRRSFIAIDSAAMVDEIQVDAVPEGDGFPGMPNLIEHTEYMNGVPVLFREVEGTEGAKALLEGRMQGTRQNKTFIIIEPLDRDSNSVSIDAKQVAEIAEQTWKTQTTYKIQTNCRNMRN